MRSIKSFDFCWDSEEYKSRYSGKEQSCTASPPEFSDRKDLKPDEFEMMPVLCCQGGVEQVVTSHPPITFFRIWPEKKNHTAILAAATTLSKRTLEENWSFNDFLFLALCHCPLKHLYSLDVGSEEREKLQSKWHNWPPCLTKVVWKSPLSNNSIPTGSCKSPHRPRSPLISISCLFSNLYSQEAESPKQSKKYNSLPWTLTALLNMDLNKVFYLYADRKSVV